MTKLRCFIFILCILAGPKEAFSLDGFKLAEICRKDALSAPCMMYVRGVVDGLRAGAAQGIMKTSKISEVDQDRVRKALGFCFPDGVSVGQSAYIVQKYTREIPEDLHFSAEIIVLLAMVQAFPCE